MWRGLPAPSLIIALPASHFTSLFPFPISPHLRLHFILINVSVSTCIYIICLTSFIGTLLVYTRTQPIWTSYIHTHTFSPARPCVLYC
ncbi:hypothetical protein C8T65DRAFT_659024 [Cerioporus squamosus]|nr:hypothetical protein C8T65DRAFT_659024 [Cerioporus squamosus]